LVQVVDENDERALEMFMNRNPAPRRTLADIILEKITEKQTELQTQFSDAGSECRSTFSFQDVLINSIEHTIVK
jgi:hypothetical protein